MCKSSAGIASFFAPLLVLPAVALGQFTVTSQSRTATAGGYSLAPTEQALSFQSSATNSGAFSAAAPASNFPFAVYAAVETSSTISSDALVGSATTSGAFLSQGGGFARIFRGTAAHTISFSVAEPTAVRLVASGPRYRVIFDGPFADGYVRLRTANGALLASCEPVRSSDPGTNNVAQEVDVTLQLAAGSYQLSAQCTATVDSPGISSFITGDSAFAYSLTVAPVPCDSIDFNQDALFPDDQDLVDFLAVLAGGECSPGNTCNDIDFNNDGLFPDDNDLVAFLRVLAGGQC
jgi:hypothetical protein